MITRADAPPRVAYTPRETADLLGMPYRRVMRLIHEQQLNAKSTGQHYHVPVSALADYLGMTLAELRAYLAGRAAAS